MKCNYYLFSSSTNYYNQIIETRIKNIKNEKGCRNIKT